MSASGGDAAGGARVLPRSPAGRGGAFSRFLVARWPRGARRGLLGSCLLLIALGSPLLAQAGSTTEPFERSRPVDNALARLQEQWLRWLTADNQADAAAANGAVEELVATAEQLGATRLPDLANAAAVRAVRVARETRTGRAQRALAAAERLDPGRPETAFAAATVHRLEGSYARAIVSHLEGWGRLLGGWRWGRLLLLEVALFTMTAVIVASGVFAALAVVANARRMSAELRRLLSVLPSWAAATISLALLLWPLVLPSGLLWLFLWWSVLGWIYEGLPSRLAIGLGWVAVGTSALLAPLVARVVEVDLSPALRAVRALEEDRLYGALFSDLEVLGTSLAGEPAVDQVFGDLHRRLGQWEPARVFYAAVLDREAENVSALLAMGAYYFRRGDYATATQYYRRAVAADANDPAGYYNLSLAYSQTYQFDESSESLRQAQTLDFARVSGWIQQPSELRVVTVDGGIARRHEIAALLARQVASRESPVASQRRWLGLVLPVGALLLASVLGTVRSRLLAGQGEDTVRGLPVRLEQAVPGLTSLVAGSGLAGFLAVLWVSALVLLPFAGRLGFRLPLAYQPGLVLAWTVTLTGLALTAVGMWWAARRDGG